jgi:hypothetical protein
MIKTGLWLLVVALLLASCAPRPVTIETPDGFEPSGTHPRDLLAMMVRQEAPAATLSGRGRVQLSMPGNTERSTIQFASDRNRTLLTFRNSLGIEAGRLLVESDSITFYNRVDQYVQRLSVNDKDLILENGFYAVNLLSVLLPDLGTREPRQAYENADSWRIIFEDRTSMTFSKQTRHLIGIDFYAASPMAFTTYLFANHFDAGGYPVPRNVQILSRDKKSSIFLTIQNIEVNPPTIDLNPQIPADVRVIR